MKSSGADWSEREFRSVRALAPRPKAQGPRRRRLPPWSAPAARDTTAVSTIPATRHTDETLSDRASACSSCTWSLFSGLLAGTQIASAGKSASRKSGIFVAVAEPRCWPIVETALRTMGRHPCVPLIFTDDPQSERMGAGRIRVRPQLWKITAARRAWYALERLPPFLAAAFSAGDGLLSAHGRTLIWGKIRRYFLCLCPPLAHFLREKHGLTGECSNCGASCNLLFRCPHWDGRSRLCLVYEDRPAVCRLFPITPADIRERDLVARQSGCGFSFQLRPEEMSVLVRVSRPRSKRDDLARPS